MTLSIFQLNGLTALRDMLDLANTGNILLQSNMHILKFRTILLEKIKGDQARETEIHARFIDRENIQEELALYEELAEAGAEITLWVTAAELKQIGRKFNIVVIPPNAPVIEESFIITMTASDGRALFTWMPDDSPTQPITNVRGVLVTSPEETRRLLSKIHILLKSRDS